MEVPHTPSTYHRTWETGLGVEIRVATFSPDFFVLQCSFDRQISFKINLLNFPEKTQLPGRLED
jgi:hypothetical protein